jgi:hypothetical protein
VKKTFSFRGNTDFYRDDNSFIDIVAKTQKGKIINNIQSRVLQVGCCCNITIFYFLFFIRILLDFFHAILPILIYVLYNSVLNTVGIPISLCALFVCVARKCGLGGINMVGVAGNVVLSLFRRKQINQNYENFVGTSDKDEQNNENTSRKLRKIPKKSKIYDFLDVNHSVLKVSNRDNEALNEFNDSESDSDNDSDNDNDNEGDENGDNDGTISRELAEIGELPDSFPFPRRHSPNNIINNDNNNINNDNNNINHDNNTNNSYNNINHNIDTDSKTNDSNNNNNIDNNLAPGEEYYFIDIFDNGRLFPALAYTYGAYPKSAKIEMFSRSLRNLCIKYRTDPILSRDGKEKYLLCLYQLHAIQEWEIYQTLLSLRKDNRLFKINKIKEKRRKENIDSIMTAKSSIQKKIENDRENENQRIKEKIAFESDFEERCERENDEEEEGGTLRKTKEEIIDEDDESSLTDEEMVGRAQFDLSRILNLYAGHIRLMDMIVTMASDLGK